MTAMRERGAPMPYKVLAGVEPCKGGWLVLSGNLQGTSLAPQPAQVFPIFQELIDWKPAFQIIAVHAPLGLPTKATPGGRTCDREARHLLGWNRSAAIASAPTRRALKAKTYKGALRANGGLNPVTWQHFEQFRQVALEMAPYWQRTVFEVNPELSFYNLNRDKPLRHSKHTPKGVAERRRVLKARFPGIERVYDTEIESATRLQVLDACANLWTARRLIARAATRMPEEPEWDDEGIRMEIWR